MQHDRDRLGSIEHIWILDWTSGNDARSTTTRWIMDSWRFWFCDDDCDDDCDGSCVFESGSSSEVVAAVVGFCIVFVI